VTGRIHAALVDAAGKTVATAVSLPASIAAGEGHTFAMQAVVGRPALWSCEEPNLYRAVTTLEVGGKAVDRDETTFGIRT
jgi:beta-galactosidase